NWIAPPVIRNACAPEPGAPEADGGVEPRNRFVDALRSSESLGPREGAIGAVARFEHVPRADTFTLDAEREICAEPDRLACAGRIRGPVTRERPLGRRAAAGGDGV